jgi:hypothetical protein
MGNSVIQESLIRDWSIASVADRIPQFLGIPVNDRWEKGSAKELKL